LAALVELFLLLDIENKMEKIDITMTATLRFQIVEQTLVSIIDKIVQGQNDRYRLIINIDNAGENIKQKEIVKIAEKYFNNIIFNCPEMPSFPKAVKWVWGQATANYIFHIEDDWNITRKIDVDDMISILNKYDKLSSLRLSKYRTPNKDVVEHAWVGCWDYIKEDGFYLCRNWENVLSLNPNMFKRRFIEEAIPKMVSDVDPEKQFRDTQKYMRDVIKNWKYGIYSKPGDPPSIIDCGKVWRSTYRLKKGKQFFITWEKLTI
jgi:hypothetical protein